MPPVLQQQTLRESVNFEGVGLHSGNRVGMSFLPAPPNTGIRFRRVDLDGKPETAKPDTAPGVTKILPCVPVNVLAAVSALAAAAIARRVGLVNTMVFTHLPSNILLALVPFAPNLTIAIALLLARSALSQMDVPTRSSYVMAVVTPEERPAAASITQVPKTFAWAAGSLISGYLLTLSSFGWPLLIGGIVKAAYDILLLIKFQKVRPPEEQGGETEAGKGAAPERLSAS